MKLETIKCPKPQSRRFYLDKSQAETLVSLAKLCIKILVTGEQRFMRFDLIDDNFSNELKRYFYDQLSPDFDLRVAVKFITDDSYWKKRFKSHFLIIDLFHKPLKKSHKEFYLEIFMKSYLESLDQNLDEDEEKDVMETIKDLSPFVKCLKLDNLKTCDILFQKLLKLFGSNLNEFDLVIQQKNLTDKTFDKNKFHLSLNNCKWLTNEALNDFKMLTILQIHRTQLSNEHVSILMNSLKTRNPLLNKLNLSHCGVSDFGAKCIANQVYNHPSLKVLNLCNNKIRSEGCRHLGFALMHPECKLRYLNVRLNEIGGSGVLELCCALVRSAKLIELLISACNIDTIHTLRVAQMIALNSSLQLLDVSNNNTFDLESSQLLLMNIATGNKSLIKLDIRNTNISKSIRTEIQAVLLERTKFRHEN